MRELTHDVTRGESQIQQLLERGSFHDFESVHFNAAGEPIDVLINSAVIRFRGERAILSINRNNSGRKRTEEALRNSRADLARAQRIAHLGNWEWDPEWLGPGLENQPNSTTRIRKVGFPDLAPTNLTLTRESRQSRRSAAAGIGS